MREREKGTGSGRREEWMAKLNTIVEILGRNPEDVEKCKKREKRKMLFES